MATILDGKAMAAQVKEELTARVRELVGRGVTPGLAVILAGGDKASELYLGRKRKVGEEVGLNVQTFIFGADVTNEDLVATIQRLNGDPTIHGIMVEQPLPKHLDSGNILATICPEKDVDGAHLVTQGRLFVGRPTFIPATPLAVITILERAQIPLRGKRAVVIGRSNVVGKPLAMLLMQRDATVTICHSKTQDLPGEARRADVLVAAIGVPEFVTGEFVRDGAVVIDVGINVVDGKTVGDVKYDEAAARASAITPVPGGVGSLTTVMILKNVIDSAAAAVS